MGITEERIIAIVAIGSMWGPVAIVISRPIGDRLAHTVREIHIAGQILPLRRDVEIIAAHLLGRIGIGILQRIAAISERNTWQCVAGSILIDGRSDAREQVFASTVGVGTRGRIGTGIERAVFVTEAITIVEVAGAAIISHIRFHRLQRESAHNQWISQAA